MKTLLTIAFCLTTLFSFGQTTNTMTEKSDKKAKVKSVNTPSTTERDSLDDYKTVQGFYQLSSFEVASGIYLLEDQTFFYYASFGNVDLKIFGEYKVYKNGLLTFYPNEELLKEFFVYGTTNTVQKDTIALFYKKPYEENIANLMVDDGQNKTKLSEFTSEEDLASASLKRPKSEILKIEYEDFRAAKKEKSFSVQLTDNIDEIKIFHNYYAYLVKEFLNTSFEINEGFITSNNQKSKEKMEIGEETINEVIAFIESRKSNTLNRNGKTYQKLKSF